MNTTALVITLILLSLGITSIFFGKEILTKLNIIKEDSGYDRIIITVGFVVSIISSILIYYINDRGIN